MKNIGNLQDKEGAKVSSGRQDVSASMRVPGVSHGSLTIVGVGSLGR